MWNLQILIEEATLVLSPTYNVKIILWDGGYIVPHLTPLQQHMEPQYRHS